MRAVVVTNRVKGYVNGFKSMIDPLMELGYEVVWAADFRQFKGDLSKIPCKIHQTDFKSNPLHPSNLRAYYQLKNLLDEKPVDLIHCNTPIGGLLGRICARHANIKNVIYTAHGFHFFKGAPFLNNVIFKWGEKQLAKYTDILLTINEEDYMAAQSFKLRKSGDVILIHGAGINTGQLSNSYDSKSIRDQLKISSSAIVLISAGELNKNKNNEIVIKALAKLKNPNLYYIICGEGPLKSDLEVLSENLKISENVKFLGFRTDLINLLPIADIFIMPSYREGLPRSLMEAMDAGLPCVVSNIRGNHDLIKDGENGFLCNPSKITEFANAIDTLANDKKLRRDFGSTNKKRVEKYDIKYVKNELKEIYKHSIYKRQGR